MRFEMALNRRGIILTSNKKYASFVNDVWEDPRCFGFSLESLLTEPVARIPRYKMLLEQLIKYTEESAPDYELLKTSLGKIAEIASENNEAIRARENRQKIMDVMQKIDAKTRINLLDTPTRWFIRSGNLQRQCRRQIKEFMFWLFSDKLLYGEPLGGMGVETFNLNRVISLMECRVTNDAVLPMVELLDRAFTIQSPAKSFVVIAK